VRDSAQVIFRLRVESELNGGGLRVARDRLMGLTLEFILSETGCSSRKQPPAAIAES
jgi:hypothetical protein